MTTTTVVHRDERTVAVENAGYRWAYLVVSYGLLGLAAVRGLVWNDAAWDLVALVVVAGGVCTAYQGYHRVLGRPWAVGVGLAVATAVLVAVVLAFVR